MLTIFKISKKWLNTIWELVSKFFGPLALVFALIWGMQQCNRANRAEDIRKSNQEQVKLAADIIEQVIDDSTGREYTTFKPNIIPPEALTNPIDSKIYKVVDSASKELARVLKEREIDKRTIREYKAVNARLQAKLQGVLKDTVVVYKDNTINWVYNPKSMELDLGVDLGYKSLSRLDGKKFLGINIGATTLYNTIWWNDSRVTINSIDHIMIENKLPTNKFLLSGKSEYRFNANQLWLGAEAEVKLDKFGIYGNYLYNPSNTINEQSVGLKYYILK